MFEQRDVWCNTTIYIHHNTTIYIHPSDHTDNVPAIVQ